MINCVSGVSLSQPQLPTVPVPAASLASVTAAGSAARVSISGLQQLNSANTSVSGLQVSATSGQHMIVVNTTVGPTSGLGLFGLFKRLTQSFRDRKDEF